jgi:hypothetical protein
MTTTFKQPPYCPACSAEYSSYTAPLPTVQCDQGDLCGVCTTPLYPGCELQVPHELEGLVMGLIRRCGLGVRSVFNKDTTRLKDPSFTMHSLMLHSTATAEHATCHIDWRKRDESELTKCDMSSICLDLVDVYKLPPTLVRAALMIDNSNFKTIAAKFGEEGFIRFRSWNAVDIEKPQGLEWTPGLARIELRWGPKANYARPSAPRQHLG